MATFYRRRDPVDAVRWTGTNLDEVGELTAGDRRVVNDPDSHILLVTTSDGRHRCSIGDWLVKEQASGEFPFSTLPDALFRAWYEEG